MQDNKKGDSNKTRNSFVLYKDLHHVITELTDEMAGRLLKIILSYVNNESFEIKELALKMAWVPIKLQLDRDLVKYKEKCDKNRKNANKRWGNKDAVASDGMRTDAKHTDNDNDNDNNSDNENVSTKVDYSNKKIIESLKQNIEWIENIGAQQKLSSEEIIKKLDDFELLLGSIFKKHKSKEDLAFHFVNWLKKNMKNEKSNNSEPKISRQTLSEIERNSGGW